jgi:peptidylprolyl isomerase
MATAEKGDRVLIHYTGKLEDGEVFDTSRDKEPLEFEAGGDDVIPGVSEAVVGMDDGQTKEVTVPPEKAYGDLRQDLIVEVSRDDLPEGLEPKVGMRLGGQSEGQVWSVSIQEIRDETVILDGNHPLAGKTVVFEIELLEIKAA